MKLFMILAILFEKKKESQFLIAIVKRKEGEA
jgi:hypothetical protein